MGNFLTTQAKTRQIAQHTVIIGGMCLLMNQKVFAAALLDHIVQPYASTSFTYDSNVLRLPKYFTPDMANIENSLPVFETPLVEVPVLVVDADGNIEQDTVEQLGAPVLVDYTLNPANNKTSKSSFIKQIKAGLAAKWQFSQQEIVGDVSINENTYSTYNELNYFGYNILGQWNWLFTQKLKGEVTYTHSKSLNSFDQINQLIPNIEKVESYIANGGYEIFPDWFLRAGFNRTRTYYPSLDRQQSNLREVSKEFGVRYLNLFENMLEFKTTLTDGRFTSRDALNPQDNTYTRINYDLGGAWNYSVKTRIRGVIGYTTQEFTHVKSLNFSAMTGKFDILWQPTYKSSLLLEAWRDAQMLDTVNASFALSQGIRFTPTWTWSETPKIEIDLPISYEKQSSLGFNSDPTTSAVQGIQRIARVNFNYMPTPNFEFTVFAAYENRSTTSILSTYQDQSVGLTLKASF
jgi:hypothetical protein